MRVVTLAEVGRGQAYLGEAYSESNAPYGAFAQIIRKIFERNPEHRAGTAAIGLGRSCSDLAPILKHNYPDVEPNPPLDPESEQALLLENMVVVL